MCAPKRHLIAGSQGRMYRNSDRPDVCYVPGQKPFKLRSFYKKPDAFCSPLLTFSVLTNETCRFYSVLHLTTLLVNGTPSEMNGLTTSTMYCNSCRSTQKHLSRLFNKPFQSFRRARPDTRQFFSQLGLLQG